MPRPLFVDERRMETGNRFFRVVVAAAPMLATPGLVYLLAEGWLDLGGGGKDILFAFPWFVWAVVLFVVALVLIIKRWPLREWLIRSRVISVFVMLVLAVLAHGTGWQGIA